MQNINKIIYNSLQNIVIASKKKKNNQTKPLYFYHCMLNIFTSAVPFISTLIYAVLRVVYADER